MGIRTLGSYVNNHKTTSIGSFKLLTNKTVVVDASIFLYQWLNMANSASLEARIQGKEEDSPMFHWEWHCVRCLDKIRTYGCRMIFLFDTGHPDEKTTTVASRRYRKGKASELRDVWIDLVRKINGSLEDMDEIKTYSLKKAITSVKNQSYHLLSLLDSLSVKATSDTYEKLKELLEVSGYRWIECPGEAEYVGIDMVKYGIADYIASNDSDCIACQCNKYITDFDWMDESFKIVNVTNLIKFMKITPEQFRIACCCMGNDYVDPIWDSGLMWNKVRFLMRDLKLFTKEDMMKRYEDQKDVLEFCWNLYKRSERITEEEIMKRMEGNCRVSPRKIQHIRDTGICV